MYFKKMTGELCYLSPLDTNDLAIFTAWLNDMEVVNFLQLAPGYISMTTEKEYLDSLAREHTYEIIDLKTDRLLGNCGLIDVDHINQCAEAGIFIGDKSYWGRGYGTEALKLLLDYSFSKLNLHNILLRVYSFNTRARRSYEKLGFKVIGERRQALLRDRTRHGIIFMDLLPEDFYSQ